LALAGLDRDRRAARDGGGNGLRARQQLGGRHQLAHQAPLQRLLRADGIAAHQHQRGVRGADAVREHVRHAAAADPAELDLGRAEACMLGRDADVAGHGGLEAAAERIAR
jgi:hypothetical protein